MILMQRCFGVIYIWLFAESHEALLNRNDERDQRVERQERRLWPDVISYAGSVPEATKRTPLNDTITIQHF